MKKFDAVIIGSGQAGNPLAKRLSEEGKKVALVESEWVGGSCVNYGCTPTKTLVGIAKKVFQVRFCLRPAQKVFLIDDFDRDLTYYNGNPAIIGVRQPLFAYNELGWDKKIEPLRYEESQKTYTEEMEAIAYFTSLYFFDLLNAQIGLEIARKNLANNDTILKISKVKFELGKISKGELLQLRLALKNSEKSLA